MTIQQFYKTQEQLKIKFQPSWRWFFWMLGLPILGLGVWSGLSIFDQVTLRCDRPQDRCELNHRRTVISSTKTFKTSEIQAIRRNRRDIGLILRDRDIRIWHDRLNSTADLEQIESILRNYFIQGEGTALDWNYHNRKDAIPSAVGLILLGSFLVLWKGSISHMRIDRLRYQVILTQIYGGIPLWRRTRPVDQIQQFALEPTRSPLGRQSFELQMQLKSGKIIPLTNVQSLKLGQPWVDQFNSYLLATAAPPAPEPIPTSEKSQSKGFIPLGLRQIFRKSSPKRSSPQKSLPKSMSLRLYNVLSRQKESFQTLHPDQVKMYCCGVTVYDYCHLGHARSYIVWDVVRRYLIWLGFQVTYVQNFTDIDDKILNRAKAENTTMDAVSEKYIAAYYEDMDRLNILRADDYPRATHTLDGIKRLIHELEQKGMAYAADGDVYYSVRKFDEYGKLSGRKLDDMQAGASGRVDAKPAEDEKKNDPFDFALWKAAKPGEPFWESDWGQGRPGWHIECSAMVRDRFGNSIDIHMGGADLCFPHHENEIAQSEGATGHPLSTYWMHNGMVNVGGEKMSKSLGNFTTIRDLLDNPLPTLDGQKFDPMAMRLFVLQAQYRKPIDFSDDAIKAAQQGWNTLKEGLLFGWQHGKTLDWDELPTPDATLPIQILATDERDWVTRFRKAMDDDFNATEALAVLFELAKNLKRAGNLITHDGKADQSSDELRQQWTYLVGLSEVLGLAAKPDESEGQDGDGLSDEAIAALIESRKTAKANKDYGEADRIRNELKTQGIQLVDKPGGVTDWIRE